MRIVRFIDDGGGLAEAGKVVEFSRLDRRADLVLGDVWMTRSVSMGRSCQLSAVGRKMEMTTVRRVCRAGFGDAFDVFEVVIEELAHGFAHHEVAEGRHDLGHERERFGVDV